MKNIFSTSALLLLLFASFTTSCQQPISDPEDSPVNSEELLFLLEEEKMARDVYLEMAEKYDRRVFKNISQSEQHHLEMMVDLAKKYGLKIPKTVVDDERGIFSNPEIQALFNEFIASGEKSLIDALKAGAKIEELDISDLKKAIAESSNPSDKDLFSKLLNASRNHLRAFVRNLDKEGVDYQPIILNQVDFDEIIGKTSNCAGKDGEGAACCRSAKKKTGKNGGCCKGS